MGAVALQQAMARPVFLRMAQPVIGHQSALVLRQLGGGDGIIRLFGGDFCLQIKNLIVPGLAVFRAHAVFKVSGSGAHSHHPQINRRFPASQGLQPLAGQTLVSRADRTCRVEKGAVAARAGKRHIAVVAAQQDVVVINLLHTIEQRLAQGGRLLCGQRTKPFHRRFKQRGGGGKGDLSGKQFSV